VKGGKRVTSSLITNGTPKEKLRQLARREEQAQKNPRLDGQKEFERRYGTQIFLSCWSEFASVKPDRRFSLLG